MKTLLNFHALIFIKYAVILEFVGFFNCVEYCHVKLYYAGCNFSKAHFVGVIKLLGYFNRLSVEGCLLGVPVSEFQSVRKYIKIPHSDVASRLRDRAASAF
jgi:hypothetical protein